MQHVFCTVEQVAMDGQGMYGKMSNTHECMESIDPRLAACMHGHSNRVTILLSYALLTCKLKLMTLFSPTL